MLFLICASTVSAAAFTLISELPYKSSSMGLSNEGPPKSGAISTKIPGKSSTDSFNSLIISNPEVFLSAAGATSTKPPPILSASEFHHSLPALK